MAWLIQIWQVAETICYIWL